MDQNKNNQEKHIPSADEVKSILGMVEDQYGGTLEKLAKGEEDYQKEKGVFVPYESDIKIIKRLFHIK